MPRLTTSAADRHPAPVRVLASRVRAPRIPEPVPTPCGVLDEIRRALAYRVVSVLAPAGMGKTTAVAAATAGRAGRAWVTATAALAETSWFLGHLQVAMHAGGGPWRGAEDALAHCEGGPGEGVIVIDDAHTLVGTPAEIALRDMAAALPENWTLVICGRLPCGLDRPRWLLASRLAEISTADLQDVRCSTWPAVERLATLDPALVGEYLDGQVLDLLPARTADVVRDAARAGCVPHSARPALRLLGLLERDGRVLAALADHVCGYEARPGRRSARPPVPAVSVSCFGGLRADVDGSALDLGELKPRARQLLRLLALSAGRPRNREELVEQLWPDLDLDSGVRSLQVAVSSLRRLLRCASRSDDAQPIVRDGPSYRLAIDCVSVDIVDFEKEYSAAKEARRSGRLRDGVIHAQRALDQYQAECLPEAGAADWVTTERDRLRRLAVRAAQMVADGQLLAGDMDAAARAGERGIEIDRFDDRLWRTLITVYRRSGDRAALCRATERYAEAMSALGLPAMSAVG